VDSAETLLTQIEPVLGQDAVPDPTFFVESWTVGVTAASENYLHRHQHQKSHESPAPVDFPSFSFVAFLNPDPPAPVAPASSPGPAEPVRDFSAARKWGEEDAFVPVPLTFQAACRLLGVAAISTREQIRAAYRKMASRYHPDRLENAAGGDARLASDRMASINEAYRLLCDLAVDRSA
jgi:DnaJ-domain-containing protein 1